jgi:uncharacterized repeat protein (TIGR01451 family)
MWRACFATAALLLIFPFIFTASAQPDVGATLEDALVDDADADAQADRGDTVGYTAIIENNGSFDAENITVSIPLDPNMTLMPGSILVGPIALDDFAPVVSLG